MSYHKSKNDIIKKKALRLFLLALGACLVLGLLIFLVDKMKKPKEEERLKDQDDVVMIGGKPYIPRKGLRTFLFIGNDTSVNRPNQVGGGQCDTLELLVQDRINNIYYRVTIPRTTKVAVDSFDEKGKLIASPEVQICLAYGNGDGKESSCENTLRSVSRLFYGYELDDYYSITMDAIPTINQQLGGVTVTIEDDFSKTDPSLKMGETITLNDDQAFHYVHDRQYVADGTNENRIKRQNIFLEQAMEIMKEKCNEDLEYAYDFYKAMQPYVVTSLSDKHFAKMVDECLSGEDGGRYKVEGETEIDRFNQELLTADQEQLDDLAIKIFFEPAD